MNIFGGIPWNDVVLAKDLPRVGSGMSLALSEDDTSTHVWTFEIFAKFEGQDLWYVGKFVSIPPATGVHSPSRIVGWACCPGAKGWYVRASCPDIDAQADCYIDSSEVLTGALGVTQNTNV